ncbi:MAG: LysR family transcriptional regulator [Lachnospiraceae bacterium]|nr:LysR family transcriptional regulator [Lachnospiraceae bacterium]MBQ7781199.1 LysR family transcriptional regulator [Lachnospiraceae bacterium]
MNQQNLNLYHIFYEVASCGNISGAARNLFISQPAISKAISKLESNLSTTLFLRSSRGVKLTPEGELLFKQIETAFHAINQGEAQLLKNQQLGVGQLSIGVSTTLCKYMLLPYLQTYIRENPHVKLSIYCQSSLETIAALESGKLDIGLVGESDRMGDLCFTPVEEIQDMFVTTKEYMEHLKERVQKEVSDSNDRRHFMTSEDMNFSNLLSQSTLLLLDKKNITRQYVEKYLLLRDITPEQQLEVTTMDLLIEFAKIGMGVACVISNFVEKELSDGTLIPFPMADPIPKRKIGFAYKKQTNPTNAMEKFLMLTEK